ncbi:phosphotransferase enzyme family protein [Legionella drancourtii]|uniref:Aminoglycoside phosphotransferase domain-containing protein n=1 Tax=Legionella drancourtii LLAP12 TaxID=658187 RepID=G9ERD1_9GAMM|nr:phosphotransferase [Legionella drancourtii]EHL30100.1 hypothetical protein LDG_7843 [Legionella drancourtii LLAP12]
MWNEVLKRIDSATTPKHAVKQWDEAIESISLVSEGINLVYRFETLGQGNYLRLTHAKLRSEDELQAAIAYQRHLFEHGVPVCEPVLSLNRLWVEPIQQGAELFLAHVCREVPGKSIHFDHTDLALYKRWGEALGKLHHASLGYQSGKHIYTSWKKSLEELNDYAQHESQALQDTLTAVTKFFNERKQTAENYGLTHGDHRKGNVFSDGQKIHVIDFDLPSMNWFMEDVARPFFNSIVHNEMNWQDKIKPYIDGYLSVMPPNSIDLSTFQKQIQMKCLEIYLWNKNNWSGDSAAGGHSMEQWQQLIYQKIIDSSWTEQLPF